MEEFDRLLQQATSNGVLPGTCVIAADKNGRILHSTSSGSYINSSVWQSLHSSGGSSTQETLVEKPFGPDTVCWIASMTKLLTTICVMKCVEQGTLKLDDDVGNGPLPEFKDVQVLVKMVDDGNGGEKPILRPSKGKVTLRNLLTHSSGMTYEFWHAKLMSWRTWHNEDLRQRGIKKTHEDRTEVSRAFRTPLVFDPQTSWSYGYGVDWAGCAVERASGLSLEAFMRAHIFAPLDMRDTTFEPHAHAHLAPRMASMNERGGDDRLATQQDDMQGPIGRVRRSGGGGLAGTARDYIKVLVSLLRNDGVLLRPSTVELMFQPQLDDPSHLRRIQSNPAAFALAGNIPPGAPVNFGLGGIVNQEPLPTGRSAGSMQWSGFPNLFWWISPRDGICGCYFSQLVPTGDVESHEMYKKFETAVNAAFKKDGVKL